MTQNTQKDIVSLFPELSRAQIKVARMLAAKVSVATAASSVGVAVSLVSGWLEDSAFSAAVEYISRTSSLISELKNEATILSWMLIVDALSKDIEQVPNSSKVEMLKIARSIVAQPDQPQGNTNVGTVQMYVSGGSVDAIARRVSELQSESIIAAAENVSGDYDIVSVDAQYSVHPETDIGTINFDEDTGRYQCHVCGKWVLDLTDHANDVHGMKREKYNELFGVS